MAVKPTKPPHHSDDPPIPDGLVPLGAAAAANKATGGPAAENTKGEVVTSEPATPSKPKHSHAKPIEGGPTPLGDGGIAVVADTETKSGAAGKDAATKGKTPVDPSQPHHSDDEPEGGGGAPIR